MPFVSNVDNCTTTCLTTQQFNTICDQFSGKVHSLSILRCGASIDCISDPVEVQAAYDAGDLIVIHTVSGTLEEPETNETEPAFNCISSKTNYHDHPFTIDAPHTLENQNFWADIEAKNFARLFITNQEALAWEITTTQTFTVKNYTEDDINKVKITGSTRLLSGMKPWVQAKSPMFDPKCAEKSV